MLKKELPWLSFERFLASDGSKMTIPEEDIALKWSTSRNALFADYFEWVFEDGSPWMWAADAPEEDDDWIFQEEGPEFSYVRDAPGFESQPPRTGIVTKKSTGEKLKVRLAFAQRFRDGQEQLMSGGERGCAHSHLRLWRLAAEREQPSLVLEDDVHLTFDRNGDLGKMKGKVFTDRLAQALQRVPSDFDVLYLGWSGWRGGNFKHMQEGDYGLLPEDRIFVQKAEYVWTTVAYVLSQAGAKKLLSAASNSVNQPVDNFMAYEASQGKLNSFVCLDEGDEDSTWAGGIVDQFDFQGDSDIKKPVPKVTRLMAVTKVMMLTSSQHPDLGFVSLLRGKGRVPIVPWESDGFKLFELHCLERFLAGIASASVKGMSFYATKPWVLDWCLVKELEVPAMCAVFVTEGIIVASADTYALDLATAGVKQSQDGETIVWAEGRCVAVVKGRAARYSAPFLLTTSEELPRVWTGRGSEELSRAKLSLEGLRHSSVKSDLQQHCVQFSFSLGRGGIRCLAAGNAVPVGIGYDDGFVALCQRTKAWQGALGPGVATVTDHQARSVSLRPEGSANMFVIAGLFVSPAAAIGCFSRGIGKEDGKLLGLQGAAQLEFYDWCQVLFKIDVLAIGLSWLEPVRNWLDDCHVNLSPAPDLQHVTTAKVLEFDVKAMAREVVSCLWLEHVNMYLAVAAGTGYELVAAGREDGCGFDMMARTVESLELSNMDALTASSIPGISLVGLDDEHESRRCPKAPKAPDSPSGGCLHYEDRQHAVDEVALEGGDGDAVYFQRVQPGSRAAQLGVRKGDEVLQVNLVDPEILFWRPAEQILPAIVGPVMLKWRRKPEKPGERTRINSKPVKLLWHDDEDELEDAVPEYPKSRAQTLGDGEWLCGSCDAKNFDVQELALPSLRPPRLAPAAAFAAPKQRSIKASKASKADPLCSQAEAAWSCTAAACGPDEEVSFHIGHATKSHPFLAELMFMPAPAVLPPSLSAVRVLTRRCGMNRIESCLSLGLREASCELLEASPDACDAALLVVDSERDTGYSDWAIQIKAGVLKILAVRARVLRKGEEFLYTALMQMQFHSATSLQSSDHARSIVAATLVIAVEAAAKEEAIKVIVGLEQSKQAELAQIIQQLMQATSQGVAEKKPKQVEADENPLELVRRLSQAAFERRFSDVQIAGNDPHIIEPLKAEARELHRELERYSTTYLEVQKAQKALASKVADAKAQLCSEADRCVDLLQELDERETEHRSLSRDLTSLKEEMKHENTAAFNHQEALKSLGDEIEEERRRYRSLQMNNIDLKAELDQAQHSSSKVETSSWKRTAMMAKLTRLQEKVHCDRTKLADSRRSFEVEEACAASLRQELEEAQDQLSSRDHDLSACEESYATTEGILQQAESELDSCTNELKAMTSEDLDTLRLEIERKRQSLARAEQGSADAVAQRSAIGQQMPEVSAMLEDRRLAAERAVDEAVAAGVAVTTAMQKLNALSDEATAAAQGLADLATRQPRASLSLTGAAATSLAADADRLQGLSDEIVVAKAETAEAEFQSSELGQKVQEMKSSKAKAWMVLQQLRKAHEAEPQQAVAAHDLDTSEASVTCAVSSNGSKVSHLREEMLHVEAEEECEEEYVASRRERALASENRCQLLQEELRAAASTAEAAAVEETSLEAEIEAEAALVLEAESEARHLEDEKTLGVSAAGASLQCEELDAEEKADFSVMVKRSRAAATGTRAAKDAAATRLQARQRGIMARSRLASLRCSRSAQDASSVGKDLSYQRPRPLPPARREEREAAAIKLQALERGILARSRVQRMRESRWSQARTSAQDRGGATNSDALQAAWAVEKVRSKASKKSRSAPGEPTPRLSSRGSVTGQGPSAELLEEQIQLREQELEHREVTASEAEAAHAREMALMASSLHRLGMRYGRLLGQCQALEALVPERVRRMREDGTPSSEQRADTR
ncbi:COLGALT1 [Symbiodinium pilosum]|uniref:COLGALT1 protein n=1 Tax=Symbiodinium pilosum TaxID=2952 RepID=A0A812WHM3_SYMPI|nr:COLGALT1 [Symbiodinium pilosum]